MATSYAALEPLRLDTSFVAVGLKRIQSMFEKAELTHLTSMRTRIASRPEGADHNDCLFQLRTWSKHRRVEERRARSHWFNQIVPTYESPLYTRFVPTTAHTVNYWLSEDNFDEKDLRLLVIKDPLTLRRLPGPSSQALAS